MEIQKTARSFEYAKFVDVSGHQCSIQQSSAIDMDQPERINMPGSSYLWLGVDGENKRMHLNRSMAMDLLLLIARWLMIGRLSE
jgi:hypothetical protein